MRIDLHTHSSASDGTQSPAELVQAAADAGLDVVALTDHDTTAGWAEAVAAARTAGVALVRGTEVSARSRNVSVHLLAYLQDPASRPLADELARVVDSRVHRAERIVDALARDVPITWQQVLDQAGEGTVVGRPHIADALVANGVVTDRDAAFGTYHVSNGGPAMSWREIAQAVFERSGRSADDVSGTSTQAYAEGVLAQGNPFAPRPLNSAMSLAKLRATGFEPEDAIAALDRYLG